MGFVSHMGASTAAGHYVAHIRKGGRWVIYNDEKVRWSVCCVCDPSPCLLRCTCCDVGCEHILRLSAWSSQ